MIGKGPNNEGAKELYDFLLGFRNTRTYIRIEGSEFGDIELSVDGGQPARVTDMQPYQNAESNSKGPTTPKDRPIKSPASLADLELEAIASATRKKDMQ